MKRLTAILVAGLFVLAPLSASAMEMMSDSNMKDVTGQAGVSIALDDVVLFQDVGRTTYTDADGASDPYTATADDTDTSASVFITGQSQMTFVNAIAGGGTYATNFSYIGTEGDQGDFRTNFTGTNYVTDNMPSQAALTTSLQGITIDVGTCHLLSAAQDLTDGSLDNNVRVAGVVIGLPNVEIVSSSTDKAIGVETEAGTAVNDGMAFISISEESSTTAILDGYVEIAPH